jgi:hypothetical protein
MISLNSQQVTIKRTKLLSTLKANLKKHVADYQQAVTNYRQALILDLQKALQKAGTVSNEDLAKISVEFQPPFSHAKQYEDLIDMFEMSTEDTVTLDSPAFQSYIKDRWHWKGTFEMLNSSYASKASGFGGAIAAGSALGGLQVLVAEQAAKAKPRLKKSKS